MGKCVVVPMPQDGAGIRWRKFGTFPIQGSIDNRGRNGSSSRTVGPNDINVNSIKGHLLYYTVAGTLSVTGAENSGVAAKTSVSVVSKSLGGHEFGRVETPTKSDTGKYSVNVSTSGVSTVIGIGTPAIDIVSISLFAASYSLGEVDLIYELWEGIVAV